MTVGLDQRGRLWPMISLAFENKKIASTGHLCDKK